MSRDDQRRRIPTSDELEQQGALAPATDPAPERRGLMRFFRAGRFRVSDDVAARKHVGVAQPRLPASAPNRDADQPTAPLPGTRASAPAPRQPASPIVPRKIRIDPSVKDRRGLGRPGDNKDQAGGHTGPIL
jgi:hypothetical protein